MAIAIRAKANANGDASTIIATTDSSPQVGDLAIVIPCTDFATLADIGTPTATGSPTMNAVSGATWDGGQDEAHIKAWWYVVNTGGAQAVVGHFTGDADMATIVYILSGADTTTPIDAAASNGTSSSSTTNTAPSVSPTSSDAYLICHVNSGAGASSPSYTPPSGMTEQYDVKIATMSYSGATLQLSSSGATGTKAFTAAGTQPYGTISLAIKTASAGGTDHPGAVTPSVTATLTPTGVHVRPAAVTGTAVATLAPTPHQGHAAAISSAVTVGLAPAATHIRSAAIAATAAATLAPAVTQDHTAATTATVTAALAAAATPVHPAAITADAVPALFLSPSGHNQGAIAADVAAALAAAETHTRAAAVALTAVAGLITAASTVGAHAISSTVIARMAATILANLIRDITVTYGQPELAWAFGPPELAWHLGTVET